MAPPPRQGDRAGSSAPRRHTPLGGAALPEEDVHELLAEARRRTLTLIAAVRDDDLDRVHDPLMSPLVWDLGFMAATRARSLDVLARADRIGPVWEMMVQHEHQHNETMLQTLQLAEPGVYAPERRAHPVTFRDGEEIRTEISAKFTHDAVDRELAEAGLRLDNFFTDERGLFGLAVARQHEGGT